MEKRLFGKLESGEEVYIYKITEGTSTAEVMEYGATLVSLRPFGDTDVVGGFDELFPYTTDASNQGALVGRVANRIENACFELDGKDYKLTENDNGNCLHSGIGFHHRMWSVSEYTENSITLSYFSPDGQDGYPANLNVKVKYTLKNNALLISYKAIPDGTTPIGLTNHAYFNLDGFGGDILDHTIQIWANNYTEVDDKLIPTGNRPSVSGTPFDLREPKRIGDAYTSDFEGYDHNMILSPITYKEFNKENIGLVAKLESSKMIMNMYTDQPGVQFYAGNFLGDGSAFKNGIPQVRNGALCLEAQTEPNCIKHGEAFYKKGEEYTQLTVYEFLLK